MITFTPEEFADAELQLYSQGDVSLKDLVMRVHELPVFCQPLGIPTVHYDLMHRLRGRYAAFGDLRHRIYRELAKSAALARPNKGVVTLTKEITGFNTVTALTTGVFIGDVEDLYNFRQLNKPDNFEPYYPVSDFGRQIANILFLADLPNYIRGSK